MKINRKKIPPEGLEQPVQYLKGVGPERAKLLGKLGVTTIEDLLYFLPWRYEDRSRIARIADLSIQEGEGGFQTIQGTIRAVGETTTPFKRMKIFEIVAEDSSGRIPARWFNQPYLKTVLKKGETVILSGPVKVDRYSRHRYLENPHYERIDPEGDRLHTGRIVPVYHETRGLTSRQLRTLIHDLLLAIEIDEFLPEDLLTRYRLPSIMEALQSVHFPPEGTDPGKLDGRGTRAHKRLAFEEFYLLELGLAIRKGTMARTTKEIRYASPSIGKKGLVEKFLSRFPYPLTGAQSRVFEEIRRDMAGPHPMNRLIQGDVGCGKTVIALMAMLQAVEGGYQAALMAPTEILAEQHFLNLKDYLKDLEVPAVLLTGRTKGADRKKIFEQIARNEPGIVIGTHALAEEGIAFGRLGLAVIDEQHKFGVLQRAALKGKGGEIDLLVMTATPIPRTLAMSLYGDLDGSIVDELPPGREPATTRHFREPERTEAYRFLDREVRKGRQGYVVFPLVEESEKVDLKAATEAAAVLSEKIFPDFRVGLLHGKLKGEEKEAVMADFKANRIQILAATTVVEVGVDVPNATVMIVEHAERFGLAQLHQLRGRVGRRNGPSSCLLLTGTGISPDAWRRIQAMVRTSDGFKIAEEDLEIRGPGELFGTRQSGIPELRVADLIRDVRILETAREDAFDLAAADPDLSHPEHRLLRRSLERRWKEKLALGTV